MLCPPMRIRVKKAWKSLTIPQLAWILLACVLIGCEYVIYHLIPITWPAITPVNSHTTQVRILFVADPQLIGYVNDGPMLTPISIWDSDRYVYAGFWTAFNYVRPDVVIFLGDLFDEGSKCTEADFRKTHKRFRSIFALPETVKAIYLPGDNDVGGEGDMKSAWKTRRFNRFFRDSLGVTRLKFVDFIKLNLDLSEVVTEEKLERYDQYRSSLSAPVRVLLNHQPILERFRKDLKQITDMFSPHFFFIGHFHMTMVSNITDDKRPSTDSFRMTEETSFSFQLFRIPYRIQIAVPSCSYRMGFPSKSGYGAATIESSGLLQYSKLWLPNRYHQLYAYAVFGSLVPVSYVFTFLRNICCR